MGEEQTQPAEKLVGSNTGTLTTTAPDAKADIGELPTLAAPPALDTTLSEAGSESPGPDEDRGLGDGAASTEGEPAEPAPPVLVRATPTTTQLQRRTPKIPQADVPWSAFGTAQPDNGPTGGTTGSPAAATPARSSERPWGQPKIGYTIPAQRSGEPSQAPAARASVAVPGVEPADASPPSGSRAKVYRAGEIDRTVDAEQPLPIEQPAPPRPPDPVEPPEPAGPPKPEPPRPPGPGPAPTPFPPVPAPTPPLPGPMPPAPAPTPPRPTPPPPGPGPVPPVPPTPPGPPLPTPVPPFPPPPSTIGAPAPGLFGTPPATGTGLTAVSGRPGPAAPTPSDALTTQPINIRADANITQPISTEPPAAATQPIRLPSSDRATTPQDGRGTVYGGPGGTAPAEMTVAIPTGNPVENTGSLTGHILAQGWTDTPTGNAGTGKMIAVLAAGLVVLVAIGLLVVFAAGDTFSSLFGGLLGS